MGRLAMAGLSRVNTNGDGPAAEHGRRMQDPDGPRTV